MHLDRLLDTSAQVEVNDLDWEAGAKAGLSPDERFTLTYFSDIESQTVLYMRDLLQLPTALKSEVAAFLSMWNYEELFHGRALRRLMNVCGHRLEEDRLAAVRESSRLTEVMEDWVSRLGALVFQGGLRDHPDGLGGGAGADRLAGLPSARREHRQSRAARAVRAHRAPGAAALRLVLQHRPGAPPGLAHGAVADSLRAPDLLEPGGGRGEDRGPRCTG